MRSEPMLGVKDVEKSSSWYQRLLGCRSGHGGNEFDMLMHDDAVLLLLHRRSNDHHGFLREAPDGSVGNGVCIYFRVDDLDAVWARAQEMGATIVEPLHQNEQARQRELELRDPDGYFVTVCQ